MLLHANLIHGSFKDELLSGQIQKFCCLAYLMQVNSSRSTVSACEDQLQDALSHCSVNLKLCT